MAAGGNPQQNLRKAIGAIKDSTKVGLAIVNSEYKDLDIAIVKATNHTELSPKEKHVRMLSLSFKEFFFEYGFTNYHFSNSAIFDALSASKPRADIPYCIHALARRLAKTHAWAVCSIVVVPYALPDFEYTALSFSDQVALKTLIVIHRALREVSPTIHAELISYIQSRDLVLNMSHFKDESTPNAWYYSTWIRAYALYLEERLECFRILKYDVIEDSSRIKELCIPDLLEQLPTLQQLLFRLLACQPEGVARNNSLIQYTLSIIAAESVHVYVAITAGTLNLVDKFFEMQRHDAVRALDIYRKAGDQAQKLSEFFEVCRGLEFGLGEKYVKIEQTPASFLTAMEEYVKEAPQALILPRKGNSDEMSTNPKAIATPKAITASGLDFRTPLPWSFANLAANDDKGAAPKVVASSGGPSSQTYHKHGDAEKKLHPSITSTTLPSEPQVTDLLGLDDLTQGSSELDDTNALARAIAGPDDLPSSSNPPSQSSDWELALVTTPSSNEAAVEESKLACGFGRSTLNRLYDNAMARADQNETHHVGQVTSNPFEIMQDPGYALSSIGPPTGVQVSGAEQQQEDFIVQKQQQVVGADPANPFGNPFL